jgi:hypothetical protein
MLPVLALPLPGGLAKLAPHDLKKLISRVEPELLSGIDRLHPALE